MEYPHYPPPAPPLDPSLIARFAKLVGEGNCYSQPADLLAYETDGLPAFRARPGVVVLPRSTEEVAAVVKLANEVKLPVVPRGSGTGLSGGALPVPGCVLVGLSKMKRILEIEPDDRYMRVEPGVINLDISKKLAPLGCYYAPDPSSQQVCSIGGNVAENSGGAHCLKYGFTTNHVLGARCVLGDGSIVDLGGPCADASGYDLMSAVVGSEGTLCIVTEVTLRILRKPQSTRTLFATFPSTTEAGHAVSLIISAGIVPAAIEMMDRLAIVAIKAATGVDWPDVGAALLVDVDGVAAEVEHTANESTRFCKQAGSIEVRLPKDEAERATMWKGRKSAFAAVGRISPNYVVQDGVIPRSDIARVLAEIAALSTSSGLRIANVFHAGDGNLHPLVLYDAAIPGQEELAEKTAGEILKLCVKSGGSITGEHGVGADKAIYMNDMFSEIDLETMQLLRCAIDPGARFNPGKVLPTPRLCGDKPGIYVAHATENAGLAGRG